MIMATDNVLYSVIVNNQGTWFYGTFNDRRVLFNSLKTNTDLNGAYIKGSSKKLDITLITLFNGIVKNGLIIYKDDAKGNPNWYIKILVHKINALNPYYEKEMQSKLF